MVYLNSNFVQTSFLRLKPKDSSGKASKERTSALMYFLAFDTVAKQLNKIPLDLNPKTMVGKNNRKTMSLEYEKIVLLKNGTGGVTRHVSVLGGVERGGKTPEKRISSNFFTTPLTRASRAAQAEYYPNRPAAPLLKIGKIATGVQWGIDYHDNWCKNISSFLSDTKSSTPFTDLAVFVLRNDCFQRNEHKCLHDVLADALEDHFSTDLARFWKQQIDKEKVFFKHSKEPYSNAYQEHLAESTFSAVGGVSDIVALKKLSKEDLIERISYLEDLLAANDIEFDT